MTNNVEARLQQKLKNIGPEMAAKLVAAGISSPEQLRQLGAKKAFMELYKNGQFCGKFSAAYLYALEGAIRDCDWREIPEDLKLEFKQYTAELRRQ